ncbi:hypothetical protein LUW75_22305 [Streptomyces sp. MRC013]|uniref:hypothetical protein n=1 Tax=Streptomyces sp. MRC013 TaxID=2898276 RepID=UPI002025EC08|nr:hypothetical protein [Streptomyces sp. MRC013]URM92229.1 hypothetical protein LUW75_22305 [Streptomyces sp. MRC013]
MPDTLELSDLDALIDDLDERITETELPDVQATSEVCSLLCTIVVCASAVCM